MQIKYFSDNAMNLVIYLAILLSLALLAAASDAVECAKGTRTNLEYAIANVPMFPQMDQSIGQTRFILRSKPHGEIVSSPEFDGRWFCFGYNVPTHFYVIGGISQKGAWLPLRSIRYLSEDGSLSRPSAFDRLGYIALSAVTSPAGRYIVFIGGRDAADGLYVLDTKRDLVRKLGPTPLPPPNTDVSEICSDQPFEWGGCWADGYIEMDTGILRFKSETVLEVKYGKDGPSARAKKRRIRNYRLDG